jgi:hypothetical protein
VSLGSPSQAERVRSLRPWFLVAAMILTWLMGVRGVTTGCETALFLRNGAMPDDVAALDAARSGPDDRARLEYLAVLQSRAVAEHRQRTLPLAVGRTLLSFLLVVASAMVLSGRTGARSFAVQILGANTALYAVEFFTTRPVRDQWIGSWARSGVVMEDPYLAMFVSPAALDWWTRIGVAVEAGLPCLALAAVLTRRSQTFLEAAALAEQRREREDEP